MKGSWSVLVEGGVVLPGPTDPGSASAFLRSAPPSAYTTTRTAGSASGLLLWERHMSRLSESLQLLAAAFPHLYPSLSKDLDVKRLVQPSVTVALARALQLRRTEDEIALTVLCANQHTPAALAASVCKVFVHASNYIALSECRIPHATGVAVMGPGRSLPRAKCSLWASTRQPLERVRPANASEIILSNDGDSLLEGTLTNFFVVARKKQNVPNNSEDCLHMVGQDHSSIWNDFEVQTAPLEDGVLPGIIRSLVIEVCKESGICFREVAPSWASRHTWKEAFLTSSIRILQPVVNIQMPSKWTFDWTSENVQGRSWQNLELEACGAVGEEIHRLVWERAKQESISIKGVLGEPTSTNQS